MFAGVAPGLEPALSDELATFGLRSRPTTGGCEFEADDETLYRLHLQSRVAARFRVRLGSFRAASLEALSAGVRALPWSDFVHPRQPIDVEVSCHRSRLRHRETIAGKAELAIRDASRVARRTDAGRPVTEPLGVLVRIDEDRAEVSVDASGELLHRRGWRKDHAGAPLRENFAAALLWLAGWQPDVPLVDPMCGSGTFAIEAATIAAGLAPGRSRTFGFQRWPSFDGALWERVRAEPPDDPVKGVIAASDRDGRAVVAAKANAKRAGVADRIGFAERPVAELVPPTPTGLVICNPPWGDRVGDATNAWADLARALSGPFAGWRWAVLAPRDTLLRRAGLRPAPIVSFDDNGTDVVLHGGGPSRVTPV